MKLQDLVDEYGGIYQFAILMTITGRNMFEEPGYSVTAASVAHWINGTRNPSRKNSEVIEEISNGEIVIFKEDWR